MRFDAVILGATGFGGGEMLRWLALHPNCGSVQTISRREGIRIGDVHPHLAPIWNQSFATAVDWAALAESEAPVLIAAMPHGEFAQAWPEHWNQAKAHGLAERLRVIDLSSDFRVTDHGVYFAAYGKDHPCPDQLGGWVYGLPEWNREAVKSAMRIANPGCFATAIQLGLAPLRTFERLPSIFAVAATGSSGSGAALGEGTHHPTRAHDFRVYKPLGHQHQIEIGCHAGAGMNLEFVPQSAPMVRGIFATLQMERIEGVRDAFLSHYADEPLVRVVDGSPRIAAVVGSAFTEIGVFESASRTAIVVATDNLGKGMVTQAIQNLNLSLGIEETTGLLAAAPYP